MHGGAASFISLECYTTKGVSCEADKVIFISMKRIKGLSKSCSKNGLTRDKKAHTILITDYIGKLSVNN